MYFYFFYHDNSKPVFNGQSLTDYNYKKPLQSDYQILDESKNFGSNSGSFVMYSMKKDKYYIYNEKESRKRYSPDSTYKIYLALFGLDRHIISDKKFTYVMES
ncbi:hypothetical protein FPO33_13880 (plasmid) [Staphylococcus aureus]|nr:hypothetical protein FPO33_13880 [Staphylococcus aureus]